MARIDFKNFKSSDDIVYPFWRVNVRPARRQSYCDNVSNHSFDNEQEAMEFAESCKNMKREVEKITGKRSAGFGYERWIYKTVAKWDIVKGADSKLRIGRVK